MKRYEHWCSLDGGGMGEPEETSDGDWVRYEDAVAAVAAERVRIAAVIRDAWHRHGAANPNRVGEYHNGVLAGLNEAVALALGPNV